MRLLNFKYGSKTRCKFEVCLKNFAEFYFLLVLCKLAGWLVKKRLGVCFEISSYDEVAVRTVIHFRRIIVMLDRDFELFFRQHEARIHFQIHRLGISRHWYDDFYSEGIVALWEAYGEFDEAKGNLGTFINYKIRYRLIDLLRSKLRRQEVMEEMLKKMMTEHQSGNRHRASGRELVDSSGVNVEDNYFWQQVRSRLTDRQWLWVKYFIIADLTVKEIMELEGVSADAVKGWGREVRRKLRDEPLWEWLDS